jgi:hypothetical protein
MRTAKAVITGASFTLVAWVCAAGCSDKTTPNGGGDTFGNDTSSSSGAGTSGSSGAASGSSGGGSSGGSSTMPTADYADGGIACGTGTGCPQSDECCFAPQAPPMVSSEAGPPGFGGFGGAGAGPSCTAAGSCNGSSLSCSNPSQCSAGQTCCFAYQQSEAGAGPGGFGGFGGGGGMTFSAQCADSCPTGDMVHYQLCASSTDCPSGQSCTMGPYTMYCMDMGGGFPGGGTPGGGMPGGPTNPSMGDDGGSD